MIIFIISSNIHSYSQEYIIDLSWYKNILETHRFNLDTIIDVRKEKNCIGYVYTGLLNKLTPAYLNKPFGEYLKEITKTNVAKNRDFEHIILRINRLFIHENIGVSAEFAYADLNMSFIIKKEGKYFEKYQASSFIFNGGERINVTESTGFHGKNIAMAINDCFKQYIDRRDSGKFGSDNLSYETTLNSNPLDSQMYKIQSITKLNKGLYKTFYDFRDYTLDTTQQFSIEYFVNYPDSRIAILKDSNKNKIKNIWGFSDGKYNYIRHEDRFYSLKLENKEFIVFDYSGFFERKAQNIETIDSLFFSSPFNKQIQKSCFKIDLTNGQFRPLNFSGEIKTESKLIVMHSKYSKQDTAIEIFVNDLSQGFLEKGTYKILNFSPDIKEVNVCIKVNNEKECLSCKLIPFNIDLCLVNVGKKEITVENPSDAIHKELMNKAIKGIYRKIE